jgi:hypothetical protein
MQPSPHQCQTWHRSPGGPQVRVVPRPATAEATAQFWRLSPPSPQARHPTSQRRAHGVCPLIKLGILHLNGVLEVYDPVGTDIHLLTCDVEQLSGVVPPMLGLTKMMICDLQLVVLL